jgi:hypothetical protein
MNMPLAADGTVDFKTTLFALVREALAIKIGPGKQTYIALQTVLP